MKTLAVQISQNTDIIEAIKTYFINKEVKIIETTDISGCLADLIALTGFEKIQISDMKKTVINIHPSLLPAFRSNEALTDAFLAGVKVSGITVHYANQTDFYGRIITQYPVLIGEDTHFDEFSAEIKKLCIKIYPKVIEAILNDKIFDFSDLFSNSCSTCNGSCNHCKN